MQEAPIPEISYQEFENAWKPFSGDLAIVKAEYIGTRSPFAPPLPNFDEHGHHNYNLTVWEGTEEEVLARLQKVKVVVVGCMDWRAATGLYEYAQSQNYSPEEIMVVTVGGGVIQDGDDRQKGLQTIVGYVGQKAKNLEKVIATGHCDRCGAVAAWTGAEAGHVCPMLGDVPGGSTEVEGMKRLVVGGIRENVRLAKQIVVEGKLIKVDGIDEQNKSVAVTLLDVDMAGPAMKVEDLKS